MAGSDENSTQFADLQILRFAQNDKKLTELSGLRNLYLNFRKKLFKNLSNTLADSGGLDSGDSAPFSLDYVFNLFDGVR